MRISKLISKPEKQAPADTDSINAKLLLQANYVRMEMAGVYSWLPLGLRVLNKVQNIIRHELDAIGAQEILMPALQPKENWETSGRWNTVDVLFKVPSQTGREYALGPTHEEIVTPLVGSYIHSYKDLPVSVYQIQTKYRDELRAKSGILRGREFGMKDMYSFHADREDFEKYYELVKQTYLKIFIRLGLDAKVVEASGGSFTKKYSHEFQVITPAGEDKIIACEACTFAQNSEISEYKEGDKCPNCGKKLKDVKGIEIANIFDLGGKFTDAFKVNYTDAEGKQNPVVMGCYGIGTTRLVGAITEVHNDAKGLSWPLSVAPFHVHLVSLNAKGADEVARVYDAAEALYNDLLDQGIEVIWDDREGLSAGEKFSTADLLGIPLRLVVSTKTLDQNSIEFKQRNSDENELIQMDDVIDSIKEFTKY
ncbi:MAG: aminoacyl--tRNA ligase-related protein [Patescibacteria group bacterium]|jgi:prolyl-tRNA synthetase